MWVLFGLVHGRMGGLPLPQPSAGDADGPVSAPDPYGFLHRQCCCTDMLWVWAMGIPIWEALWGAEWKQKQWQVLMLPPDCKARGDLHGWKAVAALSLPWVSSQSLAALHGGKSQLAVALLKAQLMLISTSGTAVADLAFRRSRGRDSTWI